MPLIILQHSSKTMRTPQPTDHQPTTPQLLAKATDLAAYVQTLSPAQLKTIMHISPALAQKTHDLLADWNAHPAAQSLAIDSFVGDIYSGFRASTLTTADRDYAQQTLRILSGLYGVLRPYDGVRPYRLEMGYKLPKAPYANLYDFWGKTIVETLPKQGIIVNTSSLEYTKTILPFVDASRVITPRFLTADPKTGKPTQVIVHTKIARGAFARWLITSRVTDPQAMTAFDDLGYAYDTSLSEPMAPTYVCKEFGGIGLSMRLQ